SIRIDQDWRGIVFKPPTGDVYVLMYVDHHDAAYRWAEGRRVTVNPATGALQVFAVETVVEPALENARHAAAHAVVHSPAEGAQQQAVQAVALYASLSDTELLSIGTPEELLGSVRSIRSESELDALQG